MYNLYIILGGDGMISVGILGATGYVGQQLVWFLHKHPKVEIKFMFLIIMQI